MSEVVRSLQQRPFTVTELCDLLNEVLAEFGWVRVEGEVQGFKLYPTGHRYFTLTDGRSNINVALFNSRHPEIRKLDDGTHVLVEGKLEYYGPHGRLSLIAESIEVLGEGRLWAKIEETKARLQAEGLFDDSRKRPLPLLPKAVGVVCGHEAAVKRDILAQANQRFPGYPIVFEEVTVQGEGAVEQIIEGLTRLQQHPHVEVIILARGGGSLFELAPFFDEKLCRAVAASSVPIVSAIGHEKDQPLTDLVADKRASTPTRAAIEVIPSEHDLRDRLDMALLSIDREIDRALQVKQLALRQLYPGAVWTTAVAAPREAKLFEAKARLAENTPEARIERTRARLAALDPSLAMLELLERFDRRLEQDALHLSAFDARVEGVRARLNALSEQLSGLGPHAILARGFSIVRNESDGRIVKDPAQAPPGTPLVITTAGGDFGADSRGPRP